MDEEAKFKDAILRVARLHLKSSSEHLLSSEQLDLEIELIDVSIDKETFEVVDDKIENKLIPVTKLDVKPDTQLIIESTLKVKGRQIISPIILNVTKEGDIELADSKAEIATITSEDETNFAERGPFLQRLFEAVILHFIVQAIIFGIEFALKHL